jgi:hypothetical protein
MLHGRLLGSDRIANASADADTPAEGMFSVVIFGRHCQQSRKKL